MCDAVGVWRMASSGLGGGFVGGDSGEAAVGTWLSLGVGAWVVEDDCDDDGVRVTTVAFAVLPKVDDEEDGVGVRFNASVFGVLDNVSFNLGRVVVVAWGAMGVEGDTTSAIGCASIVPTLFGMVELGRDGDGEKVDVMAASNTSPVLVLGLVRTNALRGWRTGFSTLDGNVASPSLGPFAGGCVFGNEVLVLAGDDNPFEVASRVESVVSNLDALGFVTDVVVSGGRFGKLLVVGRFDMVGVIEGAVAFVSAPGVSVGTLAVVRGDSGFSGVVEFEWWDETWVCVEDSSVLRLSVGGDLDLVSKRPLSSLEFTWGCMVSS